MLLGKPTIDAFEVYNDFDRNLVNLFRCMKVRPMAVIRELGFCNLNSRDDFDVLRKFFEHEIFTDDYLAEELPLFWGLSARFWRFDCALTTGVTPAKPLPKPL